MKIAFDVRLFKGHNLRTEEMLDIEHFAKLLL